MKRKIISVCVVAGLCLSAVLLLGAGEGTETDPLITLSYLEQIFTPKVLEEVDTAVLDAQTELSDTLGQQIDTYQQELEDKLSEVDVLPELDDSSVFVTVTLTQGQTLSMEAGCEFILRDGAATCTAKPYLMDATQGTTLLSGQPVQANHLYLATAKGDGMKVTTDATALMRGGYTIS